MLLVRSRDGQIIEANQVAVLAYRYKLDELLARRIQDLRGPETCGEVTEQMRQASSPEGVLFETIHRRQDGSTFPVEVSSRGAMIDGEMVLLSVIRDISERKQADEKLRRLNQALRTLGDCNQALVRATDEAQLLREVCKILVNVGQYRLAWVDLAARDGRQTAWVEARTARGRTCQEAFGLHLAKARPRLDDDKPGSAPDATGPGSRPAHDRILVIDDEEPVREALTDILEPAGWSVLTAANGEDGLAVFAQRRQEIGLVVLDLLMPALGGEETLRKLREVDP